MFYPPPASHFEYCAQLDSQQSHLVKHKAFEAMNELEGWCSYNKAAVLIDLVMLKQATCVVEIGVFGGKSLLPMAFAMKEKGGGKVYGIDPWSNSASTQNMEGANLEWWGKIDHDAILAGLVSKIVKFGLANEVELIRSTSADAKVIQNIDILHIDGNHSEQAAYIDVTKWVPFVKKGGIILFDDVNWGTTTRAVNWLNKNCIKFVEFTDTCTWAIWVKP